jgi:hypothetical protein
MPLPREPGEVHEEINGDYANQQREEHLPAREA